MEREITVVTAFFNINRENWKNFERSEDKYFEFFTGWAKLKNKLVAYVETARMKEKIMEFRSSLGLADRTQIVVVEDCKLAAPDLYDSIKKATDADVHKLYRLRPRNPEVWNADYNYVMLMKMWCVQDAIEKGYADGMVAWVDFGYNHGGAVISADSDFNFTWKYNFPDKINLFYIQKPDDRPIFDIVFLMDTYIMGTVIVGADHLWHEFWLLMKKEMMALNACGMTDDDQNIILMCYREKPEIFQLHESDWQHPLRQFGGAHLKLVDTGKKEHRPKTWARSVKKWMDDVKFAYGIYKRVRRFKAH